MLTIAVSSRSIFHLEEANLVFEQQGQGAYDLHMRQTEDVQLEPGTAFELVRKLLALNRYAPKGERLVNVAMLSRNSPDAGKRIMKSVMSWGLDIDRAVFTAGRNRFDYAKAFDADLFLCANPVDAKNAIDNGLAAASIRQKSPKASTAPSCSTDVVKIAFDGDSVLFGQESDEVYRQHGLASFIQHEQDHSDVPLADGPFKKLLEKLSGLQKVFSQINGLEVAPLRIGLVTARCIQSHARVLNTLRSWGVTVDEAVFASGAPKGPLLRAFDADFYFDDTNRHVDSAMEHDVSAGHVHFGPGGLPERKVLSLAS